MHQRRRKYKRTCQRKIIRSKHTKPSFLIVRKRAVRTLSIAVILCAVTIVFFSFRYMWRSDKNPETIEQSSNPMQAPVLLPLRESLQTEQEFAELKKEELDGVFIAGAFGNYLNIENAMILGLLPDINPEKIAFIGNSSLAGARALLLSKEARAKTEAVSKKIQYISLATDPLFQDYFIDALEFGDRSVPA